MPSASFSWAPGHTNDHQQVSAGACAIASKKLKIGGGNKNPTIYLAVTPTEGYKRPEIQGILRQDKDAEQDDQASDQVDIASHRQVHGGILQRRQEAVPGSGRVQEGDAEADYEDGVDAARARGIAGDAEVQGLQGQYGDGHREGTGGGGACGSWGAEGRKGTGSEGHQEDSGCAGLGRRKACGDVCDGEGDAGQQEGQGNG